MAWRLVDPVCSQTPTECSACILRESDSNDHIRESDSSGTEKWRGGGQGTGEGGGGEREREGEWSGVGRGERGRKGRREGEGRRVEWREERDGEWHKGVEGEEEEESDRGVEGRERGGTFPSIIEIQRVRFPSFFVHFLLMVFCVEGEGNGIRFHIFNPFFRA